MFDFIGLIVAKTGAVIGGFFLTIGVMLGGAPAAQDTEPTPEIIQTEVVSPKNNNIEEVPPAPKGASTSSAKPASVVPTTLQITNVNIVINETTALVSWKTSLPTRSRFTVGTIVYESLNGVGTEHQIQMRVGKGDSYSYYISAKTLDESNLEDDLYGSFIAISKRTAYLVGFGEGEDCRIFAIRDALGGVPRVGTEVTVRGTYKNAISTAYGPYETKVTNASGEVEYCHRATEWEVSSGDLYVKLP